VKKVLIVAVCLALVLTLAFTLGALSKKPDKPEKPPGKPEHFIYELTFKKGLDVTGTNDSPVEQCSAQGGFISSSNNEDFRPNLCLGEKFDDYEICTVPHDGRYLDLSKHKGKITMQFFFLFKDPDTGKKKKVQLNVYGDGDEDELVGEWLSKKFTIVFDGDYAEIIPTKGKRDPLWGPEPVNITIECLGVEE